MFRVYLRVCKVSRCCICVREVPSEVACVQGVPEGV